jgi:hypothetical protein
MPETPDRRTRTAWRRRFLDEAEDRHPLHYFVGDLVVRRL